jgi:hypothetical protein
MILHLAPDSAVLISTIAFLIMLAVTVIATQDKNP